ncbi:acetamidase/formamidase family protein [Leucobacter sp. gxy201]|uniref:acetamidase/formamidase family protein n=1 Tax=Leucobacter sp. gxy201 TaxID=2957200 RepID=UPI003DA15AA8
METLRFDVSPDVDPSSLVYTFGGAEAKAQIVPGTVVQTSTLDCFAGAITEAGSAPSKLLDPRYLNPQTGPFYVEGAEPGDTLAVHFIDISPRFDWGVSTTVEYFGALTGTHDTALLNAPLEENTWFYAIDAEARTVQYQAQDSDLSLALPLDPMHGTVGVAPALGEVRSALAPGNWGGNMDTPEMRAGATCYIGVNVPGALFSLGDGHARQGEGETCGVAVECSMNSVFIVELIKGRAPVWPRIETDEYLMTTGSTKPLEDAFRAANLEMVEWVAELLDLSRMDAYQLVSQTNLSPVANVVDTVYTMVCKVPKRLLGAAALGAFGGAHASLREQAAAWAAA